MDLVYSFSIFNFSSQILAHYLFSRNFASAKSSAILSFSCKALLFFDHLLEDEPDNDFLLEKCLKVTLLDLDDNCSFPSCSASLIQLWILFLNNIIFYLCHQTNLYLAPESLLFLDHLLEDEPNDDFLLEEYLKVTLLDLDDNRSFLHALHPLSSCGSYF